MRIQRVARLTPEAQAAAYKLAEQAIFDEVKGRVQHALLDTKYTPKEIIQFVYGTDTATNTDFVTLVLGKTDKTLFSSKEQAEMYARDIYKLGDRAEAVQHGAVDKWQLEIHKPVTETADTVRDGLITASNKANSGMATTLLGSLRSAADVVSKFQRGNRSIAAEPDDAERARLVVQDRRGV
jgi:hypothetical protein